MIGLVPSSALSRTRSRVEIDVPCLTKPRSIVALRRNERGPAIPARNCGSSNHSGITATRRPPGRRRFQAERIWRPPVRLSWRSEEHTSELQSLMRISYAVFCLKKKHISITLSNIRLVHLTDSTTREYLDKALI